LEYDLFVILPRLILTFITYYSGCFQRQSQAVTKKFMGITRPALGFVELSTRNYAVFSRKICENMMPSGHKLSRPSTPEEWNAYHSIRRKVLFENRGRFGVYQEDHPDEFKENHNPLLLFFDGEAIGTVRVDLVPERKMAILRLVAIKENFQRKGHGEKLLVLAEEFAMRQGCSMLVLNAAIDAVAFYKKYGFEEVIWREEERNDRSIQMMKQLTLTLKT
jgi:N-acetylglutamate synthase-like GNAT family acetyltransferase